MTTALSPSWSDSATSSGSSSGGGGGSRGARGGSWGGSARGGGWGGSSAGSGSAGSGSWSGGSAGGGGGGAGSSGGWGSSWNSNSLWVWNWGNAFRISEGRADGSVLDVGESNGCVGVIGDHVIWVTRVGGASSTSNTWSLWILIDWVWGVEPQETGGMVRPEGHGQDMSTGVGSTHLWVTTIADVDVRVTEDILLLVAELIMNGVVAGVNAGPFGSWGGENSAILDIESSDVNESTAVSSVVSDELSDNGHLPGSINGLSWTIEFPVTHTEGVEIATVLVAVGLVSVLAITAVNGVVTDVNTGSLASVRSVSVGDRVGLPDIHFGAANSELTESGIVIGRGWVPSNNVSLSTNPLDVVWALGIAVTGTVFGTNFVTWVLGHATIARHLDEVQSTVKTARKLADINIEGEFLVVQSEHLVGIFGIQEVDTGSDIGGIWSSGDELEVERVAGGGDTISTGIVGTFEGTVLNARLRGTADLGVPGVSSVAVGVPAGSVGPTPIGVQDDLGVPSNT